MFRLSALATILLCLTGQRSNPSLTDKPFTIDAPSDAIAVIRASCARCDWGSAGHEAAAVRILVDGNYSQDLLLYRGAEESEYRLTLGTLKAGTHTLRIVPNPSLSAEGVGPASIASVEVTSRATADLTWLTQAFAPILYARPNTVGRFTDLPILMWDEIVRTPRGHQIRYSVIFTNEDGGTATDRLMATWGRTTDVEFVYGVELDDSAAVLAEEFQGPGHEVPAFHGRHEGRHPLLWVSTDNNMVSESGPTEIRYAPAPVTVDLTNVSREAVMDHNPWTYTLAAKEMVREGKIVADAAAGSGMIPDLRRFVYVEACTDLRDAASVSFAVRVPDRSGTPRWFESDRGLAAFRIVRTGCFRGAVPLPVDAARPDAIRFQAHTVPARPNAPPQPPGTVKLLRVNRVFLVDDRYQPQPSLFTWTGEASIALDGEAREFRLN
jgi:hypothetical protein